MIMYTVYQDGKPADTSGYPELDESWSPDLNIHSSRKDAVRYALKYAYPLNKESLDELMENEGYPHIDVGVPVDMSMGESLL